MATTLLRDAKSYSSCSEETNNTGPSNRKWELKAHIISGFDMSLNFVEVQKLDWVADVLAERMKDFGSSPTPMLGVSVSEREIAALGVPISRQIPPLVRVE